MIACALGAVSGSFENKDKDYNNSLEELSDRKKKSHKYFVACMSHIWTIDPLSLAAV